MSRSEYEANLSMQNNSVKVGKFFAVPALVRVKHPKQKWFSRLLALFK